MAYLPIFLNLEGRRCVVIGGGEVAERKVASLLEARAHVCVVSPALTGSLTRLAAAGAIQHLPRGWQLGDLNDCVLAFAATADADLHRRIADEARALGVPINVADEPALCDFIAPSVVRRGDLQIAISTSGASPALASRMRRDLEVIIGSEYETVTKILRAARLYLRQTELDPLKRARALQAVAFSPIADHIRAADWSAVDGLLTEHLGTGLDSLGFDAQALTAAQEIARNA